jgi:YHS domain-containing protein
MKRTLALIAVLLFAVAGFAADAATETPKGPLKQVEPKTVCMVNEHAMGSDQIPVVVDGKTYYGCCDMCKKALKDDPAKRVATDPVSGKQVDKAVAIIAAGEGGRVVYFQTVANLDKYNEENSVITAAKP